MGDDSVPLCFTLLPTNLSCCLSASSGPCAFSLPFATCISFVDLSGSKLKGSSLVRNIHVFHSWSFGHPTTFPWTFSKLHNLEKILHLIFLLIKLRIEKYMVFFLISVGFFTSRSWISCSLNKHLNVLFEIKICNMLETN